MRDKLHAKLFYRHGRSFVAEHQTQFFLRQHPAALSKLLPCLFARRAAQRYTRHDDARQHPLTSCKARKKQRKEQQG